MKNLKILILILTVGIFSCKQQIPYTTKVAKDYNLTDAELKKLQFYLVGDIVLYNSSNSNNSSLEDGDVVVSEQSNSDKIIFKTGTQGVFVRSMGTDRIAVSFEKSDDYFLVFAEQETGKYRLDAKWGSRGGKVHYDGVLHNVSKGSQAAYITIKIKKSRKYSSNQRIADGRKL